MKHTLKLFGLLLFVALQATAHDEPKEGIQFFKGTFRQALAKAKAENKLVFLDAYTTWCGPCRMLQTKIFPQKEVGAYFNEKFINVKMDWESDEGLKLAEKYPVEGYPTMLFIDGSGRVVGKMMGLPRSGAEGLIAEAKRYGK